jgi:hypothetical protein
MTLKSIFLFLTAVLFLVGCSRDPLDVDASGVKVDIGFINMDSAFVASDEERLITLHHMFMVELNEIYEYELGYCLRMGDPSDTTFLNSMGQFLADPYVSRLEKRISEKFKDLSKQRNEIREGFKYLKYHFPNGRQPDNVVFMNSFFASSAFSTEKQIGIGMERYLGGNTDVIKELPYQDFPEWEKERMEDKYLSRDALCSWIMTHYVEEVDGNLAENIVRWGKILYLTHAAYPKADPSLILRYSEEDYKWAVDNEYSLWKYLVDEKLLFKIDELNTKNLLGDGPFTPGLPEKGPDRLGQFLGYRMILKYMEIKEVTLEELINTSYTDILVEYEID